jgi:hypothetical protein
MTAYNFIYSSWLPGQAKFNPDYTARCYELYPTDYPETGVFYIHALVNRK